MATLRQGRVGTDVALLQALQSSVLPWAICHSSGENFQLFLWIIYVLLLDNWLIWLLLDFPVSGIT